MKAKRLVLRYLLGCGIVTLSATGCVLPQPPVTTVWQKLGIPQATVRLRDGLINRRGNFPGLERKPPLLSIADPLNLESPNETIKVAAKVKAEEDLKKQKIKALKYLATIGCGCYDKDGAIEGAFLKAMEDCNPDVRKAAIEALTEAAGTCGCCYDGCSPTCCTAKIHKKLMEIAYGDENGCYKEPVKEIRQAAAALLCKCPAPPCVVEEEKEKLPPPKAGSLEADEKKDESLEGAKEKEEVKEARLPDTDLQLNAGNEMEINAAVTLFDADSSGAVTMASGTDQVAYTIGDESYGETVVHPVSVQVATEPVPPARTVATSSGSPTLSAAAQVLVSNPEQLVEGKVIATDAKQVVVQLPMSYQLQVGWSMLVMDEASNVSMAKIAEMDGRLLTLDLEETTDFAAPRASKIRVGLIGE